MPSLLNEQREICLKFGATFLRSDDQLKIGISRTFDPAPFPINGLRHPPESDTTGWYIWSGENFSTDDGFFVPLHTFHLNSRSCAPAAACATCPAFNRSLSHYVLTLVSSTFRSME
jgi:hypothetical protein